VDSAVFHFGGTITGLLQASFGVSQFGDPADRGIVFACFMTMSILWTLAFPLFLLYPSAFAYAQNKSSAPKSYALTTWDQIDCRSKGRFQDREYCSSPLMAQIVMDGKAAIPVLIMQITDSRLIAKPVYDYWPRIRVGEMAYFILSDLFLDDTWSKRTMPELFPQKPCGQPSWVCWGEFRKLHSLQEIQLKWMSFWKANAEKINWDAKARCFRLSASQEQK
jgi:hypothetical protein